MNKVQILGTITRDVEIKFTQTGTAIGSFGIAYNERRGDKEVAMFFDVTALGKTAENIQKYFGKGSRILIDGSLDFQQWEKDGQKRSKVSIKVNGFDFIDKRTDNTAPSQPQSQPTPVPEIDVDEQLPF